jgi:hypothetical protein
MKLNKLCHIPAFQRILLSFNSVKLILLNRYSTISVTVSISYMFITKGVRILNSPSILLERYEICKWNLWELIFRFLCSQILLLCHIPAFQRILPSFNSVKLILLNRYSTISVTVSISYMYITKGVRILSSPSILLERYEISKWNLWELIFCFLCSQILL